MFFNDEQTTFRKKVNCYKIGFQGCEKDRRGGLLSALLQHRSTEYLHFIMLTIGFTQKGNF